MTDRTRRYAIVGTGARAEMFVRALVRDHADTRRAGRARRRQPGPDGRAQPLARRAGPPRRCPRTRPREFTAMLRQGAGRRRAGHHAWTAPTTSTSWPRCEAGCDVVTEKPMTVDAPRCRRILDAVARDRPRRSRSPSTTATTRCTSGPRAARRRRDRRDRLGALRVAARRPARRRLLPPLAPRQGQLRRPAGAQGQPPLRPGQLVARRHARARSTPAGRLFFYGEAGRAHGYARGYDRAHGAAAAAGRPVRPAPGRQPAAARALPRRRGTRTATTATRTCSPPGSPSRTTWRCWSRYATGATMTYHLTAYAPWEGYRVMFNGSRGPAGAGGGRERPRQPGRSRRRSRAPRCTAPRRAAEQGRCRADRAPVLARRRDRWRCPATPGEGHGGADARMTDGAVRRRRPRPAGPLRHRARRRAAPCSPAWPPTRPRDRRPGRASPTCSI